MYIVLRTTKKFVLISLPGLLFSVYEHMHEIMPATLSQLLPPHLTLYLDAPISTLRERIAARNDVSSNRIDDYSAVEPVILNVWEDSLYRAY